LRFGIAYGLGATIYAYRDRLTFHALGIPVVVVLAMLTSTIQAFEVMMNVMLAYMIMWAAYIKAPKYLSLVRPAATLHVDAEFIRGEFIPDGLADYIYSGQLVLALR